MRPTTSVLAGALGSLLVALTSFYVWKAVAGVSAPKDDVKVIVAAIALMGTLCTSAVALIGYLITNSLNERSEARLQVEADRNAVLQRDAESRLKLEAAIQAVQLLSTTSDTLSATIQRAGALFTLSSLQQHDLAITLGTELLSRGELDPSTAAHIFERALLSNDLYIQRSAISMLCHNAARMLTPSGFEFPESALNSSSMPDYVRDWAAIAMGRVLLARPHKEWWLSLRYSVYGAIGALAGAWTAETNERIKRDTGAVLRAVLEAFPDAPGQIIVQSGIVPVSELRDCLPTDAHESDAAREIVQRMSTWCAV